MARSNKRNDLQNTQGKPQKWNTGIARLTKVDGSKAVVKSRTPPSSKDHPSDQECVQLSPQSGPQTDFLTTQADIAIYGGAAGGGKTFALLLEFLRHINQPGFGAVIFRRTSEQVRMEGGLWDESRKLYPLVGARGREVMLDWVFPSGARIRFDSLQHEKDKLNFQGAQICGLGLDELTHFSESQFFYLLSRNRSTCGVRPYIRATTNPDATSWVKTFLAPWLVPDHPEAANSGQILWMVRDGGVIRWLQSPHPEAKSVTFIRANIMDNPALLSRDPGYLANLKSLNLVDRKRLLNGDWDVVEGGNLFRSEWFSIVDSPPVRRSLIRFWDLAATEAKRGKDPDWTVGLLMSRSEDGMITIEDVQRVRERPFAVEKLIKCTAERDGDLVPIKMEQEPGSAGVGMIDRYRRSVLAGFDFQGIRSTGDKTSRAKPLSAQAEAGNVRLVRAHWNIPLLNELALFPSPDAHDDQVDAGVGAFRELVRKRVIELGFS